MWLYNKSMTIRTALSLSTTPQVGKPKKKKNFTICYFVVRIAKCCSSLSEKEKRFLQWILCAASNRSWKEHSVKQLCCHSPPISQIMLSTAGEVKMNTWAMFLYEFLQSVCWQAKTCIHQLYADTGCRVEDLRSVMINRDRCQERVKGICAVEIS